MRQKAKGLKGQRFKMTFQLGKGSASPRENNVSKVERGHEKRREEEGKLTKRFVMLSTYPMIEVGK